MTIGGAGPWIRRQSSAGGGSRVLAQLWEGQCVQAAGESDYLPFQFFGSDDPPPSIALYDPEGIINPATVAFNGGGSFGTGTVPAGSSILIPATGLYRHSFSGHVTTQDFNTGAIDYSAHMGTDETVVDIVDGYIGWNWAQSPADPDDGHSVVAHPDPVTWIGIVAHSGGAAVYWAGFNNSTDATVNQFGFTWVIEYIGPLDGGS